MNPAYSDSQHIRADAYALHAHQDAGATISAVRPRKPLLAIFKFGTRMNYTPAAGVVAGLIDNF